MYRNIGGKIKGLAVWSLVLITLAAIVGGIAIMASDDDLIWLGVVVMVVFPLFAWISTWLIYGFGELIQKAVEIERNTRSGEFQSDIQKKLNDARADKLEKLRAQGLITEEEYLQAICNRE